jgi:hypothetical protein
VDDAGPHRTEVGIDAEPRSARSAATSVDLRPGTSKQKVGTRASIVGAP